MNDYTSALAYGNLVTIDRNCPLHFGLGSFYAQILGRGSMSSRYVKAKICVVWLIFELSLLLNSSYSESKRFSISWALPSLFYLGSLIGSDGARKNSGWGGMHIFMWGKSRTVLHCSNITILPK